MKHQKVRLVKDVETKMKNTFPEVFEKGTDGLKIIIIDKERELTLIEINVLNKVYLYTFKNSDFEIIEDII